MKSTSSPAGTTRAITAALKRAARQAERRALAYGSKTYPTPRRANAGQSLRKKAA